VVGRSNDQSASLRLRILTTSISTATVGQRYDYQLLASGGGQPYQWSIAGGQFPADLVMDSTSGRITGIPSLAGEYIFSVEVRDFGSAQQQVATETLRFNVGVAPLAIITPALPGAVLNSPYDLQMSAMGGVPPYTWSIADGALPVGLNLDPLTGRITGTPIVQGTFNVSIQVTDSNSPPAYALVLVGAPNAAQRSPSR
jgi:Putative Ig domain